MNYLNKYLVFQIILLFFTSSLYSQRENFRHFSLQDGLPDAIITSIAQTNDGFIYFGTENGISRFDGQETINYSTSDGLSNNYVNSIVPYKKSGLLIGTYSGLSVFDGNRFLNLSKNNGLSGDIVNTIFNNGEEYLIGTTSGITLFSKGKLDSVYQNSFFDSHSIYAFSLDSNRALYIGTDKGLFKIINDSVLTIRENIVVRSLLTSSESILFCGTSKGLFKIVGNKADQVSKIGNRTIYSIIEDHNKYIWVGTNKGISKILENDVKSYITNDAFLGNNCYSILEDRELNLWFGSEKGVNLYDNGLFQLYNRRQGVKSTVWAIYQTRKGNLWIGTDGNGVLGFRNNEFVEVPVLKNLPKTIWNIFEDSNDNVWFATNHGAVKLNSNNKLEFYNIESGFIDDMVLDIFEDKNFNIWLTTFESGVFKYDGSSFKNIVLTNAGYLPVFNIIEDSENSLWFASSGGLDKIKNERRVPFQFEDKFTQYSFYSILFDSLNNNILLGSFNRGLIIYDLDSSSIKSITKNDGLNDNAILFMKFDDNKSNLWIGTNQGLNRFDYKGFTNNNKYIRLKSYNYYDGFPGVECNQLEAIYDTNNQFWFSTREGVVKYNPSRAKENNYVSQPFISSVEINYKEIDLSNYGEKNDIDSTIINNIEFPHDKNNLTISFSSLYYTNPLNVKFKYMLHGVDEQFSPLTKNDYVTYSSLSPGNYQFELISYTLDGEVPSKPIHFNFSIETPFWKSDYFVSFVVFLIIMVLYILYRVRIYTVSKKNVELLKLYRENISNQKLLEESEKDYKGLFENAHSAILIIDPDSFLIIDANHSAELLYGYNRVELINLSTKVLTVHINNTQEFIDKVIQDKGVKKYKTSHIKKDGSEIILNVNASTTNYKGKTAIISLHRDITEEEEIKRQLLIAKDSAEKSDKLKGEFLAQISHEIRTPINTILGYVSLINTEIEDTVSEEVNNLFEPIKRSSARIIRTIDLILDMSEVNAGTFDLSIKKIDVAELLYEIVVEQRQSAKSKNLKLEFINNSTNSYLLIDYYTFGQIFTNLVDNAIKYTEEGKVELILSNAGSKTIIEIQDTGIGISEEFLPTLFDSFTQEEQGYTRKYDGNGLGLALVKNYVKINKGIISVESTKGIGSKFRVEF